MDYIVPYGSNEGGMGWSVSEPHLRVVKRDDGSTDLIFGMRLFCSVPSGGGSPGIYGECAVSVDVCYKPM